MNLEEFAIYHGYASSGDEDEDMQQEGAARQERSNAFSSTDRDFKSNYRLTKDLARQLIEMLRPLMRPARRSSDLSVETKVLVALNFFAKGSYQSSIGNHKNAQIAQGTVSNCLTEVTDALNHPSIFGQWVKFPSNIAEMMAISQQFYEIYRLPGVVGCIDCTHVAIHPPPNNEQYEEAIYVNRKGYHSINTQLICDANLRIINVNALFPGGTHDSFIWNQSNVLPVMEQLHRNGTGRFYLIGDSGYGLRRWLHTPIQEPQGAEQNYNDAFKSARATIERCNGVLKSRFRCLLKHRVLHYSPEKASKIINSCCVLHNMCIRHNIDDDDVVSDEEGYTNIDFGILDPIPHRNRRNADLIAGEVFRNNIVRTYF
ncbi:unnamed protein product [Chilo suppressalis]|uniref:Putative nuclease HARBI1 n=1 Tax=Chilo suppressalis TaxID=168631 RepID=A0ABN8B9V3_CHISP|nr:unnamed protein product [Chilo suppressalis]